MLEFVEFVLFPFGRLAFTSDKRSMTLINSPFWLELMIIEEHFIEFKPS